VPYTNGCQVDPSIFALEAELLRAGLSYTEIAARTGQRIKTISERNRIIHKINIWEAFRRRIKREGVPNRLKILDSFGFWFAGFFDGEGSIVVYTRNRMPDLRYAEYRLAVRIMIRDDDAHVITSIKDNLQVGHVSRQRRNGTINPAIAWTCERIQDLAEVIIPLFDRYPLQTKKAQEYALWRPLVMQRYITTLGGYSNRSGIPNNERAAFHKALEDIQRIRMYRPA
jgi:hypothetical protein